MRYLGSLTDVSQIPTSGPLEFADNDVIYVKNDGRFIIYDDGEWGAYDGTVESMIMSLGTTPNMPITDQPDQLKGVVTRIEDLPWCLDAAGGDIYRIPKYNLCFYRMDDAEAGISWVQYVTNYYDGLTPSDVVDNCESEDTDKPLSANQGRVLYGMIAGVETALAAI